MFGESLIRSAMTAIIALWQTASISAPLKPWVCSASHLAVTSFCHRPVAQVHLEYLFACLLIGQRELQMDVETSGGK